MGWGSRIVILYGSFVALMVGMVILAFQQDFDLVADDYYEQEIAYQERIDQITNARDDGQKVTISKVDGAVRLAFASEANDVKVHFFRPSDDTKDIQVEEATVESEINVPISQLSSGKYLIKVEWKANGKTYFQEGDFIVAN